MIADTAAGWVLAAGAGCPIPRGTIVDVLYRDGGIGRRLPAGVDTNPHWRDAADRFWIHEARRHSDIMAYRLPTVETVRLPDAAAIAGRLTPAGLSTPDLARTA